MGSSGSGKSTLLYALSGMDRLSGGQLFYKGKFSDEKQSSDGRVDIAHASEKELTFPETGEQPFGIGFPQGDPGRVRCLALYGIYLQEGIHFELYAFAAKNSFGISDCLFCCAV